MSPAKSKSQRRLAGMDLARLRAGKKTITGMNEKQLEEFASSPKGKKRLPEHVKPKGGKKNGGSKKGK